MQRFVNGKTFIKWSGKKKKKERKKETTTTQIPTS